MYGKGLCYSSTKVHQTTSLQSNLCPILLTAIISKQLEAITNLLTTVSHILLLTGLVPFSNNRTTIKHYQEVLSYPAIQTQLSECCSNLPRRLLTAVLDIIAMPLLPAFGSCRNDNPVINDSSPTVFVWHNDVHYVSFTSACQMPPIT